MIDFGYGLTPSATLKIETVDNPSFAKLHDLEPDVSKCIACGSCTASCSAGVFTEMSLRRVILSLQRGREKDAKRPDCKREDACAQDAERLPYPRECRVDDWQHRALGVEEVAIGHLALRDEVRRVEIPAFVLVETANPHGGRTQAGKPEESQQAISFHKVNYTKNERQRFGVAGRNAAVV